jgi:hypothetical protein
MATFLMNTHSCLYKPDSGFDLSLTHFDLSKKLQLLGVFLHSVVKKYYA